MNRRARILNGAFDRVTFDESVAQIVALLHSERRGWVCTVNVAYLMMMRADPRLQAFVDRAALVVADGQPLVWFAPSFGAQLPERVAGIDLIEALAAHAEADGTRVGLIGAPRDIVEHVAEHLHHVHPRLQLSYVGDGFFTAEQAGARADAIREAGVQLLFVGMGVPRQERFIEEQWDRLGVRVAIGVGGSFEVLSGERRRAPRLLQHAGLEWAFRLAQEPRRLWKRYLVTNSRFLWLLGRRLLGGGDPRPE